MENFKSSENDGQNNTMGFFYFPKSTYSTVLNHVTMRRNLPVHDSAAICVVAMSHKIHKKNKHPIYIVIKKLRSQWCFAKPFCSHCTLPNQPGRQWTKFHYNFKNTHKDCRRSGSRINSHYH